MQSFSHISAYLAVQENYKETDLLSGHASWPYPHDSGHSSTNE